MPFVKFIKRSFEIKNRDPINPLEIVGAYRIKYIDKNSKKIIIWELPKEKLMKH